MEKSMNEFLEIYRQVPDKADFLRFVKFCIERIQRGEDEKTIWAAWLAQKNSVV